MAWQPSHRYLYDWIVDIWRRQSPIKAQLDRIEQTTAATARDVRALHFQLAYVGPIEFFFERGSDMSHLKFWSRLPVLPTDPDVLQDIASGELTVTIAGGEPLVIATPKSDGEPLPDGTNAGLKVEDERFTCQVGDVITGSFVYIDPASNRSVNPATSSVVAAVPDTTPPADPGALELAGFELAEDEPVE